MDIFLLGHSNDKYLIGDTIRTKDRLIFKFKEHGLESAYSFGHWIKRRRKALDLTQEDLAKRVGCSLSTLVKIEADARRPSRQIAELLARHLEIQPEQLDLFIRIARQEKRISSLGDIPPLEELPPSTHSQPQRSKLPRFPTSFVGRADEINHLVSTLLDPACRLVTVTGPGGTGKTRFAVQVARRLEASFSGGVYYFSMAAVARPESIIPALADGLGVVFSGPADPLDQILHSLRHKESLLVLDNMEHLLEGWGILERILGEAPKIKLLLTSRLQIQLQWEWIFELQGLPVPDSGELSQLAGSSAAELFLQRARQVQRGFRLSEADAPELVQIIQLVEGLPLAIELAASWTHMMTPAEIASELERNLDLLTSSHQDIPDRHRSLRAVFEHSWRLLDDAQQQGLMRLSVFSGGFTRPAAQEVAGAGLPLLSSLITHSLLWYQKDGGFYHLHELVRQYARERLRENGGVEAQARDRHCQYYAAWIHSQESLLKSAAQIQVSLLIQAESANWISAWDWAVKNQHLALLRQMLPCLYWYFEVHGYYAVALVAFQQAAVQLRVAGAPQLLETLADQSTFAFLVDQMAWFEFRTGKIDPAEALFSESLELALVEKDSEVLYHIYGNWGYMKLLKGDIPGAVHLTMESLACARQLDSAWHVAIPASVLGIVKLQEGKLAEAYQELAATLDVWRSVGDLRGLVFCTLYLSQAALALGFFTKAEAFLAESNAMALEKGDRWALAFGLDLLGQVALGQSQPGRASQLFQQSRTYSQEIGDSWASNRTLIHLAETSAMSGLDDDTRQMFQDACQEAQTAGWLPNLFECLVAYLSVDSAATLETRIEALAAVLANPELPSPLRLRAEGLLEKWKLALPSAPHQEMISQVEAKNLDTWAQELLGIVAPLD